ncbi:hypothetical protein LPJ73_001414 [Coemansia sp. RSA 2703]|nr:hypothetical protein LPJ73_001414 [Coemansia sp. RSA 2703]KAJ2373503.1 hypothetical protein IW150_003596 [Coemansia sp. RSA 2607]KAJ2395890.1 hypothetical protein GGI05_001374 [Coemansia sp. RSA 2603]
MTESSGKIESTSVGKNISEVEALIKAQENDAKQMETLRSSVDDHNKDINELQEQIGDIRKLIDEDEQKLIDLDEAMEKREVEIMELVHGIDTATKLLTSKEKRIEALGNVKTKSRSPFGGSMFGGFNSSRFGNKLEKSSMLKHIKRNKNKTDA